MRHELTVTTGWGQGRRWRFIGFADGEGGLSFQHMGRSTTVITAMPRRGDAIVEMDGEQYACWFRNLDPIPARIVVVHDDLCHLDLNQFEDVDRMVHTYLYEAWFKDQAEFARANQRRIVAEKQHATSNDYPAARQ